MECSTTAERAAATMTPESMVWSRSPTSSSRVFRAEADYQDGRRPEMVVFASAEADAQRRDFTVNGLFFDPLTEEIHDWVGGEKDLRAKIIRTIGAPEER